MPEMEKLSLASAIALTQVQETRKAARSSNLSDAQTAITPKHSRRGSAQPQMPPGTAN
jgi:hypothetical protein